MRQITNIDYPYNLSYNHKDNGKTDSDEECLLKSLLGYLRKPIYDVKKSKKETSSKFWDVFRIISLSLVIALFLLIFISIALNLVGYDQDEHALADPAWENPAVILLFGVLIAPIWEESTFRLGLKFSPFRFSISLALLLIIFYPIIFSILGIEISESMSLFLLFLIFSLVGIVLGLILKIWDNNEPIVEFYTRNFRFIFYLFAILFAGVHLTNYGNFNQIWFLAPLIVAPQFVGGLFMGYVRMKYGFRWSVFHHMSFNAILFIPTLFIAIPDLGDTATLMIVVPLSVLALSIGIAVLISSIHPIWEYYSYKRKQTSKPKTYY